MTRLLALSLPFLLASEVSPSSGSSDRVEQPDPGTDQAVCSVDTAGSAFDRIAAGSLFEVVDDVLDPDFLAALKSRVHAYERKRDELAAKIGTSPGTVWLDVGGDAEDAKHAIELAIRDYISLAIGPIRSNHGFAGVDWWTQVRRPGAPQGYHSDTDTELCHRAERAGDNCEKLGLVSIVSTVFILDAGEGGPTVVFNQSFNENGLVPRIPEEVLLIPPKANRLIMFRGDRYHGVLHSVQTAQNEGSSKRMSLLANVWRKRPDTSIPTDEYLNEDDKKHVAALSAQLQHRSCKATAARRKRVPYAKIKLKRSFDGNLDDWIKQRLPREAAGLWNGNLRKFRLIGPDDRVLSDDEAYLTPEQLAHVPVYLQYKESAVNKQIPPNQRVPTWAYWS